MLAPCYDYSLVTLSLYEHLVFDLCITLCFDQYIFVAVHDYGHYALLVGRIPVFLLASTCIVLPMHPTTESQVFHQCPPYLPICGISLPLLCGLFMCYL